MSIKIKIERTLSPMWQYLQQPVFKSQSSSVWNIKKFHQLYEIKFLEKCWQKDNSQSHQR